MSNKLWMLRKLAEVSYISAFNEAPSKDIEIAVLESAAKFGACGLAKEVADKAALGLWKQTYKSGYRDTYHTSYAICQALSLGKMTYELRRRIVEFLPSFGKAMLDRGVVVGELPTPQQIVDWLVECGDEA